MLNQLLLADSLKKPVTDRKIAKAEKNWGLLFPLTLRI